jgi:hypothetical protein
LAPRLKDARRSATLGSSCEIDERLRLLYDGKEGESRERERERETGEISFFGFFL